MESVAFYSYKGGVGRSLLAATTARFLAMCGHRVVALDLDLEAPGLTYKFGLPEASAGAVDVLTAILSGSNIPDLVELTLPVALPGDSGALLVLAAGAAPSTTYWARLAALHQPTYGSRGGIVEAALELQARIASELGPDYLLIDARTGVSELGGLATTAMADRVVLVCTRSPESVRGTSAVHQALKSMPTLAGRAQRSLEVVVSRSTPGQPVGDDELKTLFGTWFELPHDARDGAIERTTEDASRPVVSEVWVAGKISGSAASVGFPTRPPSLLAESLAWAGRAFPNLGASAEQARQRLLEIDTAIDDLTRPVMRLGPVLHDRPAWDSAAITRSYAAGGRVADLVIHHPHGKVGVVLEYVDGEDPAAVAESWFRWTSALVVVIRGPKWARFGRTDRQARDFHGFGGGHRLPMPHDLELLEQPADFSLKSLLAAVHRTRLYDGEILRHWAHLNNFGIHGGSPWDRDSTTLVLDTVAGMGDVQRFAQFVARAANLHEPWVEQQLMDDEPMRLRALTELVAPLVWRGPPAALAWLSNGRHGNPPLLFGLQLLARHMGLRYDPDALFREHKQRGDSAAGRWMELQFDWQEATDGPPARYESETGKIHLDGRAIEEAADLVGTKPRALGSVLGVVQAVRGLLHVATDLDGQLWRGAPRDEAPRVVHALVAAVVDRVLDTLADPDLRAAFEVADTLHPRGHGAWRALREASNEALHHAILTLRRGHAPTMVLDAALDRC